jgi:hypothetical protein
MIKDLDEAMYYGTVIKAMEHKSEESIDHEYYGRSYLSRNSYLEAKHNHLKKEELMKQLENYAQYLEDDIMDMVKEASLEEKQMLQKKIVNLTTKL